MKVKSRDTDFMEGLESGHFEFENFQNQETAIEIGVRGSRPKTLEFADNDGETVWSGRQYLRYFSWAESVSSREATSWT